MPASRRWRPALHRPAARALTVCLLPAAAAFAGCTGATVGSGVGEARFEHAPYYAGRRPIPLSADGRLAIAYAPVAFQRGATMPASFDLDDGGGSAVGALLDSMNAFLDDLADRRLTGPVAAPVGTPPDVEFGCAEDGLDECVMEDEGPGYGPGRARMRLAVGRPSGEWTASAAGTLAAAGADALLVITLEVGQYWPRQTDWRGSKAVELGTERTVGLPWLTAIDAPVSVIQLTGALMGPDGKAIRIGAEGLRARRTPLLASGFGVQAVISDDDIAALHSERVEGDPSRPLVWQAALRSLVAELTGTTPAAPGDPAAE